MNSLVGFSYHGSAAIFDLLIIILVSGIRPLPELVLSLHRICAASILINVTGWVIWVLYFPPILYDLAFVALYAWLVVTLISRDKKNVGGNTLDRGGFGFRFDRGTCSHLFNKHGGKI